MKKQYRIAKKHLVKGKKLRQFFLNFGKVILDATKLCFASLVLGTIIKGDFSQSALLLSGIIASGLGTIFGTIIIVICEE